MKYSVSKEEKCIIKQFQSLSIPDVFKTDSTDFILFVEEVDFTVCEILLKGKEITKEIYEWIVNDSDNGHCPCLKDFVKEMDKYLIGEANQYCYKLLEVMKIFEKYYKQ